LKGVVVKGEKKKKNRLTPQRAKLIKIMAKGKSVGEAAKLAGYSCTQAASNAVRSIRSKMSEVLDRNGLTDEALISKYLKPLLTAEETLFFQHQGIVLDKRRVAALGIRSGALDMALKLKGSYPKNGNGDAANGNGGPAQIIINLGALGPERAFAILTGQSGGGKPS